MLSSDLGKEDVHIETKQAFYQLFSHRSLCYTDQISPLDTICEGEATGQLIGGNLTLLVSTLGTPFELDTKNRILFIEDIDEEPYEIDRMMTQLYMANNRRMQRELLSEIFITAILKNVRSRFH